MTRILALVLAMALFGGCTSYAVTDQAQEVPASPSGQVDASAVTRSILDAVPREEIAEFDDDERYLINLLASPFALDDDYMVNVIQVDDPNGGAEIGDRWYEPRLREEGCSIRTDQAPMPIAEGGYIPGDPMQSSTRSVFAVMGAPHQLGARIQLFDTSEQCDSFAAVMREFYVKSNDLECGISLFDSEIEQFTPADVGYQGYGFRISNAPGTEGTSFVIQHLVGDRVLLSSTLSAAGFDDEPGADLELATLEPFIEHQVASLQANGLG